MPGFKEDKLLRENGFAVIRQNGEHIIYSDGLTQLSLSRGRKQVPYLQKRLRSQIRRALERRQQAEKAAASRN